MRDDPQIESRGFALQIVTPNCRRRRKRLATAVPFLSSENIVNSSADIIAESDYASCLVEGIGNDADY